ncbi:2-oxoglutaramate amidase [Clostridiales bacterium]|nr:2-oxoglutaramate amidase [Clostridiales bacterium]
MKAFFEIEKDEDFKKFTEQYGKMLNYAVTVDTNGNVISRYAKVHPYSHGIEAKFFSPGQTPEWFHIKGVTASPLLCYDARFPEMFQILSRKSRLIIICACWPDIRVPSYDIILKARAIENQAFIAVTNRVGIEMKYNYNGHSQVVNPYGQVLTEICEDETLIIADLDISQADEYRTSFDVKKDRKPDFYKKWL